jgi:ornithine cyclodeaminase/alanine dehydrogenase-like protein (mu-crystallin family)
MLFINEDDVRRLLPMRDAVELMRRVFADLRAGRAVNQPRRRLAAPGGVTLHQLAGAFGPYVGTKTYATSRHGAWFLFMLFSAGDGKPLAIFEANWLGQIRTGAASGFATDLLAPREARTVGVIGAGFQARSQVQAMMEVRPVRRVRVWSRREEHRRAFAAEFGPPVEEAGSAEEAVRGADIVITATNSRDPVLEADWVAAGAHVNAIGSNQAGRRELPAALIERAALVATDSLEQARIESGDLLLALDEDGWRRVVELKDVEPADHGGITIFKSNGLGVEDVAAAGYVYERYLG